MLELKKVQRSVCEYCCKLKVIGYFDLGYFTLGICPTCLENAARLIANKTDKVYYDRDTNKWMNLYREDIQEFEKLYPNVNIIYQLEVEMPRWLKTTKGLKKSRKSNWQQFINNWLKKEQIKGVGL